MKFFQMGIASFLIILFEFFSVHSAEKPLSEEMQKIMQQSKYDHALWGLYVKDLQTGEVVFDINAEKFFSPASTTKLFSVAALLHAFGEDYRFKTPIFMKGTLKEGRLEGDLILVAQGDLTMGGRQPNANTLSYTKLDHINANEVPGAILTNEDPLSGFNALAKQIHDYGINQINGDVLIDDSLFETTHKRGMVISPIMINENFIDFVIDPTTNGQKASLTWRPQVPGYSVVNDIQTVGKEGALAIEVSSDDVGHHITLKGTIPIDQKNIVRTFSIQDPKNFARAALIQALQKQGLKIKLPTNNSVTPSLPDSYRDLQQVAVWVSPPLSEYAKLILKVSHNLGADLVPLLLTSKNGEKTFDEGMRLFGQFVTEKINLSPTSFVFIDAAGGNENRLTPLAEVKLLEILSKQSPQKFRSFFDGLPILGVDGSLEDFAKNTEAVGKVRAKTGTGVAFNLATGKFFLITQALAGYIEGKNGHLFAFMLAVNNAAMPTINDVFAIFEDVSMLSSMVYTQTND